MEWYVLHVRTGREPDIKAELRRLGYTSSVPEELRTERRGGIWTNVRRIVIPGYVFLKLDLNVWDYYRVCKIPHVIRFLGSPPVALRPEETDYIDWLANNNRPLEPSEILVSEGDDVTVVSGPLQGYEGRIVKLNYRQRRAVLAVTMAGRRQEFSLSANILKSSP